MTPGPPTAAWALRYEKSGGGGTGCAPIANSCAGRPKRLCGAVREWSRNIAPPARVSSTSVTGADLMLDTAYGAPPEYTKMPPIGVTTLWSVLRTERTGPATSGTCDWKIASRRVIPLSTTSS